MSNATGDAQRRSKSTPAEFPTDWHYDEWVLSLERNVAGLQHRVTELEGTPAATAEQIEAAKQDVKDARAQLRKAVKTHKANVQKRPKKAQETAHIS